MLCSGNSHSVPQGFRRWGLSQLRGRQYVRSVRWLSDGGGQDDRAHGDSGDVPRGSTPHSPTRGEAVKGAAYQYFRGKEGTRNNNWVAGVKNLILPRRDDGHPDQRGESDELHSSHSSSPFSSGRIMNTRKKFSKSAGRGHRGGEGYGGEGDANNNGSTYVARRPRKGRNNENEEDENDGYFQSQVPPNILPQLFDMMELQNKIEDKKRIDKNGFDRGDKFIADVIVECLKSEDGVYREVFTSKVFDKIQIPIARPSESLLMATMPDIQEKPDSIGYKLGCQAWQVLSKNYYFSQEDCKYMSQKIARLANKILSAAREDFESDGVLSHNFRKGLHGMDLERRRLEELSNVQQVAVEQGVTDWDQDAVVDEDELFGDEEDQK